METSLHAILEEVLDGDKTGVEVKVREALEVQIPAEKILNGALIPAMGEVGIRFERGELYVPEMLIAARAMKAGLALIKRHLVDEDVEPAGKIIVGTVKGDLHDIGKNLVAMMLEGAGFEIIDLGTDVSSERYVASARDNDPDIVGMSALLTTTMQNMKSTIKALEEAGLRSKVKVIVGGAPVTQAFSQEIGADGFATDASSAVSVAKRLV